MYIVLYNVILVLVIGINFVLCIIQSIVGISLASYDPFADTGEDSVVAVEGYIHIRIQQRNGRKTLTTVQGIPADLDQKRILKAFKKEFACNGTLVEDDDLGQVIQLQGDHRLKVQTFLATEGIAPKDKIKLHGF